MVFYSRHWFLQETVLGEDQLVNNLLPQLQQYVWEHSMCDILDLSVHKLSEKRCFLHCQKQTYVMGSEVDHACPCRNWDNGLQSLKQLSIFDLYTII